jgi:DNA-binding transcriptional LysR family regulator
MVIVLWLWLTSTYLAMPICFTIVILCVFIIRKRMKRLELPRLDWDDMQCFLVISRIGTLSGAAQQLGVTQPTMGRRLERLHERVGTVLLQRTPTGFVLTAAGDKVLAHIERMDEEALAVGRALTGGDDRLTGEVRITTVEAFGAHILIPELPLLLDRHPKLSIEIDVDTRSLSLARREADVAVRMGSFKQHDVIVRKAGAMAFAVYAAHAYLERFGYPTTTATIGHRIITLQNSLLDMPEGSWFNSNMVGADTVLATNSREGQFEACLAGAGLACLPRYLADSNADLVRLTLASDPPVREIWVGTHRDTQGSAKIRAVLDWIEGLMQRARVRLNP